MERAGVHSVLYTQDKWRYLHHVIVLSLARLCVCLASSHLNGEGWSSLAWSQIARGWLTWGKMLEYSVQKNSHFQTRDFVANWGKTVIQIIDYACMNYTSTHSGQSGRFKKTKKLSSRQSSRSCLYNNVDGKHVNTTVVSRKKGNGYKVRDYPPLTSCDCSVFQVGQGYPHDPPKVKCETMVYHPNIDLEGNVCLNILRYTTCTVVTLFTLSHLIIQNDYRFLNLDYYTEQCL
jgi:hypothetical protein